VSFEKLKEMARAQWDAFRSVERGRILVGAGTCGRAAGAGEILEAIHSYLASSSLEAEVHQVGCLGLCYAEPLVELAAGGAPRVLYGRLAPEDIPGLLRDYFCKKELRPDLALATMGGGTAEGIPAFHELPMLKGQVRIVLRNCGLVNPESIFHYIACGGYAGLKRALGMTPEQVIEELKRSGLRGRGGAGFPTGVKWDFCRRSPAGEKYIICNADEGDPGAFMDRSVIESDPHSVLEGMAIAAYAIGAAQGYVYVRAEYPLAIERLNKAIHQAHEHGLLGKGILGSDFCFHVKIKQGAGAFVCGEETALMASLEGKRGMPRPRPPFPAQEGLYGRPTNINNVETLANVPVILERGSEWFSQYGTQASRGTKTFALTGKVVRTGLVEVPMGTPLRDIVFDIGGGMLDGKRFKAVQTGGPSGGCIPASLLDMPVDYENLARAGSIMGSGGMVVMDEDTCMVDIARYFLRFTRNESCGKCAPCRLGTDQMLRILDNITRGEGRPEDIELLLDIAVAVKQGSLCGLGQTASNPVLTTIRYFRDEYRAHILRKKCPATVCRGLVEAPCKHTCPAGVDVPRYIRYIAAKRYADALDVIREKIPFPAVCGRICFHPCERKCRRRELDEAVAVRALKRFAVEKGTRRRKRRTPKAAPTGKRVAVVGSGPAGLTAAYYLAKSGHRVTVFEKLPQPGGMLRSGIPAFRLPRQVLDEEIKEIKKAGVRIRTNSRVASVDKLFKRGYDAILLAIGAHRGLKMGIPGEDAPGVHDCITFLREVNMGVGVETGKRVAVVGGGSSAMDAARTAVRQGACDVTVIYRRTRAEMPAAAEEVEEAASEGVKMRFLAAPTAIRQEASALKVDCIRMELGPVDESGRPRPLPVEGSEFEIEVDSVIMAVGQVPEALPEAGCEVDERGRPIVDEMSMETNRPGLFAAGDMVTGPASVIEAIAAGRAAAQSIDRYLGGRGNIDEVLAPAEKLSSLEMPEEQEERPRTRIPQRSVAERLADAGEVELGYSEQLALMEASRCLRCDLEETED